MINLYKILLSETSKNLFERVVMKVAIATFIIHLLIILLCKWGWLGEALSVGPDLNPVSAIYTPFSIILFYEIYLLVYYLPQSITHYIGKQYEIICLIMIRSVFEQLGKITTATSQQEISMLIFYKLVGVVVLFFLIFLFYRLSRHVPKEHTIPSPRLEKKLERFISVKRVLSTILLLVFIGIIIYSMVFIYKEYSPDLASPFYAIKKMNKIFYSTFFSILILAEVLLLLFTIELTERFSKVIRNSAFIISTVLLKLSFSVEGVDNIIFVVTAISFSVLVLVGYVLYRRFL
ncbi:MAG: hypothetical protein ACRDDZ_12260 [Marinifilaceae bacterium]